MSFGTPSHPISNSGISGQPSSSVGDLRLTTDAGLSHPLEQPLPSFAHLFQRIQERDKRAATNDDGAELANARQKVETLSALLQRCQNEQRIEREKFNQLTSEHDQLINYATGLRNKVKDLEKILEQKKGSEPNRGKASEKSQELHQKEQELNLAKLNLFNLGLAIADLQNKLSMSDSTLQFNLQRCSGLEIQCNRLNMRIVELEKQLTESTWALQTIAASLQKAWETKEILQTNLNQANRQLAGAAATHELQLGIIKELQGKISTLEKQNQRLKDNAGSAPI